MHGFPLHIIQNVEGFLSVQDLDQVPGISYLFMLCLPNKLHWLTRELDWHKSRKS